MLLNLKMVMHEPWKASAPEVYLLTTTDGSVPRGLDPNTTSREEIQSKKKERIRVAFSIDFKHI